ncbi:MAG TPA: hypothetical protein PKD85_06685 [Saprospiraceae bacterium]|mgnify:CR=1 FL=1|nr:hypothetical protein [Saprospiraceae bacterium]
MELHIKKEFVWELDVTKRGFRNVQDLKRKIEDNIPEESFDPNIKIIVEDHNPFVNVILQYNILSHPIRDNKKMKFSS